MKILGIISILYGLVVMSLNSGSNTFMIWIALGVVLIAISFIVNKVLKIVIRVALIVGLASLLVVEGFIATGFFSDAPDNLDYIIVEGAQVKESGPSAILKYRLDEAYDYLVMNEDTVCIVSGGQGANEPTTEAEGMRKYLLEKGIAKDRILTEDKSLTTFENLKNSKKFLKEGASVGIVTNNYHMFRSVKLAEYVGIDNVHGIPSYTKPMYLPNNMLREYFGVLKDGSKILNLEKRTVND